MREGELVIVMEVLGNKPFYMYVDMEAKWWLASRAHVAWIRIKNKYRPLQATLLVYRLKYGGDNGSGGYAECSSSINVYRTECKTLFNNKMFEGASLSLSQIGQGANPPKPSTSTSEFDDLKDPTSTYALLPSPDLV